MKIDLRFIRDEIRELSSAFVDLFFPRLCPVCGTSLLPFEKIMCMKCQIKIPLLAREPRAYAKIEGKITTGVGNLKSCTAMFLYSRDLPYYKLIHEAKYYSRPHIARELAAQHTRTLIKSGYFDTIHAIMPVPLHFLKEYQRGYNQAEAIARGVQDVTNLPIVYNLAARRMHSTQTKKSHEQRIENAKGQFKVNRPEQLIGKHILLVDDVITTGATISSAIGTLCDEIPNINISVMALASTPTKDPRNRL